MAVVTTRLGADLSQQQWHDVCDVVLRKNLLPFVDIAYQGFGEGLDEDAYGVQDCLPLAVLKWL